LCWEGTTSHEMFAGALTAGVFAL